MQCGFRYFYGAPVMRNHFVYKINVDIIIARGVVHLGEHRLHNLVCCPLAQTDILLTVCSAGAGIHDFSHIIYALCLFRDDFGGDILQREVSRKPQKIVRHRNRSVMMRNHLDNKIF